VGSFGVYVDVPLHFVGYCQREETGLLAVFYLAVCEALVIKQAGRCCHVGSFVGFGKRGIGTGN
jgi:hypothetical protein